ncbi:hypothetical protein [Methylobacterium sp. ID0610]|uniref:hypothetical protein n=1 Tax=Methylobacterium carpenticola TaxID=3344827 RepID=UPI0036782AC2
MTLLARPLGPCLALLLLAVAPAHAISDRRDQPRAAEVPAEGRASDLPPPQTLKPDTKVMPGDTGLTGNASRRTNPLDHIPAHERRATGAGDGAGDAR